MSGNSEAQKQAIQKALDYSQAALAKIPRKRTAYTELLKQLIEGADVAFGVLEDLDRPKAWVAEVIKGAHLTIDLLGDKPAVKIAAISCTCHEEALAMREVFGDGRLAS